MASLSILPKSYFLRDGISYKNIITPALFLKIFNTKLHHSFHLCSFNVSEFSIDCQTKHVVNDLCRLVKYYSKENADNITCANTPDIIYHV